jgi:signal transduction histidine kinase
MNDRTLVDWLRTLRPLLTLTVALWLAALLAAINARDGITLLFVVSAVAVTVIALRRGQRLAERQHHALSAALASSDARNRELERLRQIGETLLSNRTLGDLQQEVAFAAADLLEAESGAVTIVVEEGRFLRMVAAGGQLASARGMLVPVDGSLLGWVVTHDQPLLANDVDHDARSYMDSAASVDLRTAAIAPLRASGVVLGTVAVYNRRDGKAFTEHDLQLLQVLGDQVMVALDRTAGLEASRQNEAALVLKNRELVRATRLKSEFLANMSHELRTPLNAIIGFSDLLRSGQVGGVNEVQADFLESVLRNGRHLLGLINNVLDLSKIEAGRMTLDLGAMDIRQAIEGAVADTASLRAAKGQRCATEVDPAGDFSIQADSVRVRQVLFNLLANASKFTPEGGEIAVQAVRTRAPLPVPADRSGDEQPYMSREVVWVSVLDNGIGIRPEDRDKLFQEFSQVDSALNRQQQGTGLGLALCRSFVEMHGGTIGVDSIPGRGSTFWFLLPVEGPVRRPEGAER